MPKGKGPTKTWKARERQVAKFFGCLRQRLSGSSGRDDESESDTTHDRLFIEVKLRKANFPNPRALLDECRKKCTGVDADKVPVLAYVSSGKPGFLVIVHSDDLAKVAEEYLMLGDQTHAETLDVEESED